MPEGYTPVLAASAQYTCKRCGVAVTRLTIRAHNADHAERDVQAARVETVLAALTAADWATALDAEEVPG